MEMLHCCVRWVLSWLVNSFLLVGIILARWRKCKRISRYWSCKWIGDDDIYNPNRNYMEGQLKRPICDLYIFITQLKREKVVKDKWKFLQYMAYLSKILEMGDLRTVLMLELEDVFGCCYPAFAVFVSGGNGNGSPSLVQVPSLQLVQGMKR